MDFTELIHNSLFLYISAFVILLLLIIIFSTRRSIPKKIESIIRSKRYVPVEQFMEEWKENKQDYPGCYVILIYDKRLILNPMNYDDIYVGQSVNVRHRVFSHLMGHGNGNVYFGLKSGFKMFVIIVKCNRKKLNKAEIDLIDHFNATNSLNMTRGGAARRK